MGVFTFAICLVRAGIYLLTNPCNTNSDIWAKKSLPLAEV